MSWFSDIVSGGASVINDTLGTNLGGGLNAEDRAQGQQTQATGQANAALLDAYTKGNQTLEGNVNLQTQQLAPWREHGINALDSLRSNNFMDNFTGDPGYKFRFDEGQRAVENSASAHGMLNSGATMKALARYGQGFASNEYGNAYNREYGRLSNLAGMGERASVNSANLLGDYSGQLSANQIGLGTQLSNNMMGLGNAMAAGEIGRANRIGGLVESGAKGAGAYYGALAASDRRVKTDIREISKNDLKELRTKLTPYIFKYKDAIFGKGDFVGVMAQDLEKSKLGRTLVFTDSDGVKKIDLKRVLMMLLASEAEGRI